MDIADEFKNNSGNNKPPLFPKPCLTPPSSNGMEHIIPQMIVTLADDIQEDDQNVPQISTSEVHASEISSDILIQKETEDVVPMPTTSVVEQSLENRIKDVESEVPTTAETRSIESVTHSTAQRPLTIDSEKSVSHPVNPEVDRVSSSESPVPDPVPVTAMQRPLIFNGPHAHPETAITHEDINSPANQTKENFTGAESAVPALNPFPQPDLESSNSVQQSLSSHVPEPENFSYRDLDERDEMIRDAAQDTTLANRTDEQHPTPNLEQGHMKKDGIQNVKKFFGSLLPETQTKRTKSTEDNSSSPDVTCKKQNKSEKQSIKKLFSPSKTDSAVKDTIAADLHEKPKSESSDQSKDSKYNIKKMFDSFKQDSHDSSNKITSKKKADDSHTKPHPKDSKSGIKGFFQSFKHEASDAEVPVLKDVSQDISIKVPVSVPLKEPAAVDVEKKAEVSCIADVPSSSVKGKESDKSKQKDNVSSVKKFFDSFKHDIPDTVSKDPVKSSSKVPAKKSSIKKSHSFKETLLSNQTLAVGITEESHSVDDSSAHPLDSAQSVKDKRSRELKRSQSCRETTEDTEVHHGFRKFLDSLTHKKVSSQPSHKESADHIYDVVEKTAIPPATSCAVDPKPTSVKKEEEKHKEDQSGVKKLFDSFRHKETPLKPKKTDGPKKVQISDNIMLSAAEIKLKEASEHVGNKESTKKLHSKESNILPKSKEITENQTEKSIKIKTEKSMQPHQMNGPSTITDGKSSMLHSISDNFTAFKDKIFQPKEDKKCKLAVEEEVKVDKYDFQEAARIENPDETAGTYRPLSDPYFTVQNLGNEPESKHLPSTSRENAAPKQPLMKQTLPKPQSNTSTPKKEISKLDTNSKQCRAPETLYDTCCFKLAVLFSNKAIEMVSDKGKIPPKKPPKPTAEAIARARANVVSQRLREMHSKGQSIGENIPVGYDGIRFADDETESSCDYKDVDNFDYIMDYELINRYKFDNKLDSFTDASTCSGSYYTADTVTLKDETFSDAPLETISLGSDDSCLFRNLSTGTSRSEGKISPAANNIQVVKNKSNQSSLQKHTSESSKISQPNVVTKVKCSIQSPKKRIPPPLPPKPIIPPKQKPLQSVSHKGPAEVSQCINGLSLSPRLQSKFAKDSAATKKRPLLVTGLKETEFVSLQTKSRGSSKQPKERKFDMVLKNESLKNISTISPPHKPLTSTKSSPGVLDGPSNSGSLTKKVTPQRPPLPLSLVRSEDNTVRKLRPAPQVPEKPKRDIAEKRTLSPPRPPPPTTTTKFNTPPPRPPPPILELQSPEKAVPAIQYQEDISEDVPNQESTPIPEWETRLEIHDSSLLSKSYENISGHLDSVCSEGNLKQDPEVHVKYFPATDAIPPQDLTSYENIPQELLLSNDLNDNKDICTTFKQSFANDGAVTPKPPPRGRRIRSRTVEVVRVEKSPEPTLRRSQSLSDIDVQKRTLHLSASGNKTDLKQLYTSINKNSKKPAVNLSESSSLEKLSVRPLPAPPPPPRKFRSLDRKPKEKGKYDNKFSKSLDRYETHKETPTPDLEIHPPVRKKKVDKRRFHSLGHDHPRNEPKTHSPEEDSKIAHSLSNPIRPDRRHKYSTVEYDENANVAFPVEAEVHRSDIILDECGNEIQNLNIPDCDVTDSSKDIGKITPNPRRKKDKIPSKEKAHSSWYDESQASGEWEMVDWDSGKEMESKFHVSSKSPPARRKSDPGKGTRRTSKFYVDVQSDTGLLPLVDKETSPLPLDCSEKSVQTSLETLSQGMASRDEEDEDTDDLLDLAQTLQNELKVIINRHKVASDAGNDSGSTNTPMLSGTDSEERNLGEESGSKLKKSPSIKSSNSEFWPLTSSEESDGEIPAEGSNNLTEIAVKRKQKRIFYIAQEIMTSEEVFVDSLKLLNEDFKSAVESANQQKSLEVVPAEVLSQILNHLPQLQHLNENLLMELKDRIENWEKIAKIADIIVKMGPFLKLYSWFIHDFESNLALLEDSKKKYPLFAQVVKEFEASARCKRLTLNHYMLKPIQRIPQYRLLLQEYLHHLPEEHVDYQDTVAALQIVSEVATHANDSMKHGDNAQKLISIQNSILGHKEIIKPGRLFVKEGILMKLSRKGMQPRWFILFNDLLLYLTPVQQGLYRVNHELPLTGMKVAIPIQQDYQNEFSIISVARSFTLAARSPEERQEWIVALTKAIEENASKRSTFTNIRLQQRAHDKTEEDEGEFVLGKKAPVWIPDARVTMCQLCTSEFTVTFRRHHCRACGKVVCSICSSNRISLPYLGNRIARVCDDCHSKIGPGSGTCTESAETDSDNQQIAVKPHLRTENKHVKRGKRNLPSVLKEVCANDQGSTISGYLQKKSGKSWKRDWFVVKDKVLYEYKASEDVAALKSLPLLGYQIESFSEAYENVDHSLLFQLTHPGQAPIVFYADSVGSTERWISALKEASVLE